MLWAYKVEAGETIRECAKEEEREVGRGGAGGGAKVGCTQFVHSRIRMTIDPRIPTMPGRSASGFYQPSRAKEGERRGRSGT